VQTRRMTRLLWVVGVAALLCASMRVEGQSEIWYVHGIQIVKSVSGVLQDDEGTLLSHAAVQEFGPEWKSVLRTTETDSEGRFSFPTVTGREIYWLQASTPGFLSLRVELKLDREHGRPLKLQVKSIAKLASERDAMLAADPNHIAFERNTMSCRDQTDFLSGDYNIVRQMRNLPEAIQQLYTMKDGSRSAIADPGDAYEAGDAIGDLHMPRRRLRFAGVSKERVFVYYDHGGIGNHSHLAFFRISGQSAVAVWNGSGAGDDLGSLRDNQVSNCHEGSSHDM
jgi:hypothetical protein